MFYLLGCIVVVASLLSSFAADSVTALAVGGIIVAAVARRYFHNSHSPGQYRLLNQSFDFVAEGRSLKRVLKEIILKLRNIMKTIRLNSQNLSSFKPPCKVSNKKCIIVAMQ